MKLTYLLIIAVVVFGAYFFYQNQMMQESAEKLNESASEEAAKTNVDDGNDNDEPDTEPVTESASEDDSVDTSSEADLELEGGVEAGVSLSNDDSSDAAQSETKVFNVTGYNYGFNLEEIRVKEGDTVTINFESTEGYHDWVVDEFSAATQKVTPGTMTSVTFVADKAGVYEYYCSVGSHRVSGMVGQLIVE